MLWSRSPITCDNRSKAESIKVQKRSTLSRYWLPLMPSCSSFSTKLLGARRTLRNCDLHRQISCGETMDPFLIFTMGLVYEQAVQIGQKTKKIKQTVLINRCGDVDLAWLDSCANSDKSELLSKCSISTPRLRSIIGYVRIASPSLKPFQSFK